MSFVLYALCEPDTGDVRYVGLTRQPAPRLRSHEKTGPVSQWIARLKEAGQVPLFVVLATIGNFPLKKPNGVRSIRTHSRLFQIALAAERAMIEHFHRHGTGELLNVANKPAQAKGRFAGANLRREAQDALALESNA